MTPASGLHASCTLELSPGTYAVAMPSTIGTPDSEVDIALRVHHRPGPPNRNVGPGGGRDRQFCQCVRAHDHCGPHRPSEPTGRRAGG